MGKILLYGATGYMGKLAAKELMKHGLKPILAGRSDSVKQVAAELGSEYAQFSLSSQSEVEKNLEGVSFLINLAGPFALTQKPLIEACITQGCHYIDIAGEVDEMESAHAYDEQAEAAGIMLMPGAGFGVVPTDIAAKMAHDKLPNADQLSIYYATEGGVSRGTLATVLKDINRPGVRRENGAFVGAKPAESAAEFEVDGKRYSAVYNPWRADLFTAGISTAIPNIKTYSVFPGVIVRMMNGWLIWLRDLILRRLIRFLPEGPSPKQLESGATYVLATVSNGSDSAFVGIVGPEAYLFTAICLVEIAKEIQANGAQPGFQTPAIYGRDLLEKMESVKIIS